MILIPFWKVENKYINTVVKDCSRTLNYLIFFHSYNYRSGDNINVSMIKVLTLYIPKFYSNRPKVLHILSKTF